MYKNKQFYIRKTHRYLGVFIGIQFLLWTIGGLYFSWTEIDEIHGDYFLKEKMNPIVNITSLSLPKDSTLIIEELKFTFIGERPFYLVNSLHLFDAETGLKRGPITREEATQIGNSLLLRNHDLVNSILLSEVDTHHEYRGRPLPVWQLTYQSEEDIKVYISAVDGSFQRIRHRQWRWFDFLWMLHTMDYEGRDDLNNMVLRGFSILGLCTVMSGFLLFFLTLKFNR